MDVILKIWLFASFLFREILALPIINSRISIQKKYLQANITVTYIAKFI